MELAYSELIELSLNATLLERRILTSCRYFATLPSLNSNEHLCWDIGKGNSSFRIKIIHFKSWLKNS